MSPHHEIPYAAVSAIARELFGETGPIVVVPMVGGASTRKFARVTAPSGQTAVAIYVPEAHQSDEIAKRTAPSRRWPFLEVRDLLAAHGVRVPRVFREDCDAGLLLVEDLGDLTLAAALEKHPNRRDAFYRQAIADLAEAQTELSHLPADSIVRARRFDRDLLHWEVEHFREWALEARGIQLTAAERSVFDDAAGFLAQTISEFSPSFVHRDYQSRNIMVRFFSEHQFELVWIDFQDALIGPRAYDLVALLGDSYQVFERPFIDEMLAEYANRMGLASDARPRLSYEFDLVTVQRKLKDAGRFVFIDRVKGNSSFLGFVEPTIDKVLVALGRLRDEPTLRTLEDMLRCRLVR